jgi:hypothetical protein
MGQLLRGRRIEFATDGGLLSKFEWSLNSIEKVPVLRKDLSGSHFAVGTSMV